MTIFPLMLGLAVALVAPLMLASRERAGTRGRREAALAIHRAQLDELDRDLQDGRLSEGEYAGARLEIQRRLLDADQLCERTADGDARRLLVAMMVMIPLAAFLLYLPGSTPDIPSEPHAAWLARQQSEHQRAQALIAALRAKLATQDPDSSDASEGQAFLAEALAEDAGQLTPEAIALFRQSLAHAPAHAPWRRLDLTRLSEAATSP